jgi:hypothetical protein
LNNASPLADGADEPDQRTAAAGTSGESVPPSGARLVHNFRVRGSARSAAVAFPYALMVALVFAMTGCSATRPDPDPTPSVGAARQADRDALAGLAAAAKDRRYVATYTLSAAKRPDRTVTVAMASDGSWVVAVPGGALDGLADVAVFRSRAGLFQCSLGPATGSSGERPDLRPVDRGCVKVSRLTERTDPRVHHIFTDWIDALVDRATALSVSATDRLAEAEGQCFSVESTSAALAPPMDPGVYCYRADGLLTAARARFGTLRLAGAVGDAPSSVAMPAPRVDADPLPVQAPPPPTTAAAPTATAQP